MGKYIWQNFWKLPKLKLNIFHYTVLHICTVCFWACYSHCCLIFFGKWVGCIWNKHTRLANWIVSDNNTFDVHFTFGHCNLIWDTSKLRSADIYTRESVVGVSWEWERQRKCECESEEWVKVCIVSVGGWVHVCGVGVFGVKVTIKWATEKRKWET